LVRWQARRASARGFQHIILAILSTNSEMSGFPARAAAGENCPRFLLSIELQRKHITLPSRDSLKWSVSPRQNEQRATTRLPSFFCAQSAWSVCPSTFLSEGWKLSILFWQISQTGMRSILSSSEKQ